MMCACGRPLHYGDKEMQAQMERLCDRLGPDIRVTVGVRSWMVQRHYIALHGLKAADVASLGFPEVSHETHP